MGDFALGANKIKSGHFLCNFGPPSRRGAFVVDGDFVYLDITIVYYGCSGCIGLLYSIIVYTYYKSILIIVIIVTKFTKTFTVTL